MKYKIRATSFNGKEIETEIELFLEATPNFSFEMDDTGCLSLNSYGASRERVLGVLRKALELDGLERLSFRIVSKDLETMNALHIVPNKEDLVDAVSYLIFHRIAEDLTPLPESGKLSEEELLRVIGENKEAFIERFVEGGPRKRPSELEKAEGLYREKRYAEVWTELMTIDSSKLDRENMARYDALRFELSLKNYQEGTLGAFEKSFNELIERYGEFPEISRRIYFSFIRFLEDLRAPDKARQWLDAFIEKYPLSILDNREKALYHHLQGRAFYAKGEFLEGLNHLTKALSYVEDDEALKAAIFNTSVNPFNDNLFFEEAERIAQEALNIRERLDRSKVMESLSCLAGVKFKSASFDEAYELFEKAYTRTEGITMTHREENRMFNYLAQSAVMAGETEKAGKWLEKAKKTPDEKGFTAKAELLYLLKRGEYGTMRKIFKKTIMLPEHHRRYDNAALGWGYTFMAIASFEEGKKREGVEYLYRAANFFLEDMYYLEAAYITMNLYRYSLDKDEIDRFWSMDEEDEILRKFDEYVAKHSSLRQRFYPRFFENEKEAEEKVCQLEELQTILADVMNGDYMADEVVDLMDRYCLY